MSTIRIACLLVLLGLPGPAMAEVAARTHAGQTLNVPDADFERGQIFYVLPGQDTQLALTSDAPLQRSVLTTSRAVGYLVGTFDPEDSKQPILGGALRVPVASLASDSASLNAQLMGENYFRSAEHPEITFELTGASDVEKLDSDEEDVSSYRLKLQGQLSALGLRRDVEMTAEVHFRLTNFTTFTRSVGDLITLSGRLKIDAGDFGWQPPPRTGSRIASSVGVDVFLVGSTRSPENSLDPNLDRERWHAELHYLTLARDFRDEAAAAVAGQEFLTRYTDDPEALRSFARVLLEDASLLDRDLGLAQRLVERAHALDPKSEATQELTKLLAATRGD